MGQSQVNFIQAFLVLVGAAIVEILMTRLLDPILPELTTKWHALFYLVLLFVIGGFVIAWPVNSDRFAFQVRVQEQGSGMAIANADVTVDVAGAEASFRATTDTNGLAAMQIPQNLANNTALLTVLADGYHSYRLTIAVRMGELPLTVQLEPLNNAGG